MPRRTSIATHFVGLALESDRLAARLASLAVQRRSTGQPVRRSTHTRRPRLSRPRRAASPGRDRARASCCATDAAPSCATAIRSRRRRSSSRPSWTTASRKRRCFSPPRSMRTTSGGCSPIRSRARSRWSSTTQPATVLARRVERLGAIVLRESSIAAPSEESFRAALLHAIRRRGVATLPWSDGATRIRERMAFVAANDPEWPDVSDDALAARLDEWLGPSLAGVRRLSALQQVDLADALLVAARLAAASRARCARSVARRRADRVAHSHRLLGSARAESRRATTGSVRADRVAARSRRPCSGDDAAPLARAPARADDARPRGVLANELLRRAKGSARAIPAPRVARRSAHRRADETRQAAPLSATGGGGRGRRQNCQKGVLRSAGRFTNSRSRTRLIVSVKPVIAPRSLRTMRSSIWSLFVNRSVVNVMNRRSDSCARRSRRMPSRGDERHGEVELGAVVVAGELRQLVVSLARDRRIARRRSGADVERTRGEVDRARRRRGALLRDQAEVDRRHLVDESRRRARRVAQRDHAQMPRRNHEHRASVAAVRPAVRERARCRPCRRR